MGSFTFNKSTVASAIAVTALALGMTLSAAQDANAGSSKKFWTGFGAGVATGVIVGGVAKSKRQRHYIVEPDEYNEWDAHVDWCYDNKRRYRERDNTWKPYNRSRRECYSPYYN